MADRVPQENRGAALLGVASVVHGPRWLPHRGNKALRENGGGPDGKRRDAELPARFAAAQGDLRFACIGQALFPGKGSGDRTAQPANGPELRFLPNQDALRHLPSSNSVNCDGPKFADVCKIELPQRSRSDRRTLRLTLRLQTNSAAPFHGPIGGLPSPESIPIGSSGCGAHVVISAC